MNEWREGRLRGGFEAYLVTSTTRCFFVCLCFSGQRGTVALKLGVMYEEHLCVMCDAPQPRQVGNARGVHAHPLASYFIVRSSTALRLFILSGEQRCLVFSVLC